MERRTLVSGRVDESTATVCSRQQMAIDMRVVGWIANKYPDMDANKATAISLYSRYLKRVAAHSKNLISSIVNPFERIGYGEK